MIQLSGAGKRYGPKILFQNVDWLVTPNERAGVVGANGTGKSSLLKVLAGMEGVLVRKKTSLRVVLTVEVIMRSIAVEVDVADIEPITTDQINRRN